MSDSVFARTDAQGGFIYAGHPLASLPQAATCYFCAPPNHRLYGE